MSTRGEQPTPRRLREARARGSVARSKILSAAATSAAGLGAIAVALPHTVVEIWTYAADALVAAGRAPFSGTDAVEFAANTLARLSALTITAIVAGAFAGSALQTGIAFHAEVIQLRFEQLSPAAGLRRLFGRQGIADALRGCPAVAVAGWLLFVSIRGSASAVSRLPGLDAAEALSSSANLAWGLGARVVVALAVLGAVDLLVERRALRRNLMMTREEVRQEYRQSEGDPQGKARRKALHRSLLAGGPARGVEKATVVLINPTHVAVALRYEPSETEAPFLVAKGAADEAARMRHQASRLGIPLVKDVPLARALFRLDLGDEIPEELYRAVAVILRVIQEPPTDDRSATPPGRQA